MLYRRVTAGGLLLDLGGLKGKGLGEGQPGWAPEPLAQRALGPPCALPEAVAPLGPVNLGEDQNIPSKRACSPSHPWDSIPCKAGEQAGFLSLLYSE